MDDLFKAMSMFQEGARSLQLSRSLNEANDAVHQIKSTELADAEKMQQIRGVASDLTVRLAGMGTPATTIQAVQSAFKPQEPTEFQQNIYMEGLKQQGQQHLESIKEQYGSVEKGKDRQNKIDVANIGANKKENGPLSSSLIKPFTDLSKGFVQAEGILEQVKDDPKLTGLTNIGALGRPRRIFDKDYAKFEADYERWFQNFKHAMTGANAGEKEMEELRRGLPKPTDPPGVFRAKLIGVLGEAEKIQNGYVDTLMKAGYNRADAFRMTPKYSGAPGAPVTASPQPASTTPGGQVGGNKYLYNVPK